MTLEQAVYERHSVRSYLTKPVPEDIRKKIESALGEINAESGLHFQVLWDCPELFPDRIRNAGNCIAFIGKKSEGLDEAVGYYGAKIMLIIQTLGLNSVWLAKTFNERKTKSKCDIPQGEELDNVLAFGYGENQGVPHKSKPVKKLYSCEGEAPESFMKGVEFAALAPTAINQQQFLIKYADGKVTFKAKVGPYNKIDLGIVRFFYDLGSGKIKDRAE